MRDMVEAARLARKMRDDDEKKLRSIIERAFDTVEGRTPAKQHKQIARQIRDEAQLRGIIIGLAKLERLVGQAMQEHRSRRNEKNRAAILAALIAAVI